MITMHPTRRVPGRLQTIAFTLAALIAVVDQAAKAAARAQLDAPIDLTPFLSLRLGFNPGVTFGLFAGSGAVGRWALSAVAFLIIGALLAWIWRTRSAVTAAAAGLIAGGAIGNLVDRLRFGAVTDFIDLHWGAAHWPTFNLADAAIVCGVALLLLTVRGSDSRAASSTLGRAAR
ncbi:MULTISPECIES: signal peptidase II [Brevundimonas]|jgi:signal peptidase II|uniref:signal peptidase II n=1 Tax=Brevundimonas TaxID=41275 RepID=UPI00106D0F29|nr:MULTISPECIES: signal peptidase II [Brevundimonas]QBQ48445.1 signal peptidase II [Brevundimonas naejangsanensis]QIF82222.1 signal peptidase II [Brevundimonas sp. 'scallop']